MKKTTLSVNNYVLTSFFLLISTLGISQSQTFTTVGSNSFTVPAGVTTLTIHAWGGGGRGGSAIENSVAHAGGGGGGGAYSKKVMTVIPDNTYNLVVGSGGDRDTNLNGGDSTFNVNSVIAKGGVGVATNSLAGGNGGIWASGDGDSGYSGGNGAAGVANNYGGGGGSSACTAAVGNNGSTSTGATAPCGGGNGGNGATTNGNNGLPGIVPGGGGGGATKGTGTATPVGGDGANGKIIISWSCPTYSLNTTTVATPLCNGNTTTVSVSATAANLPTGTYTVTYDLGGPNAATNRTATMTVSTAGSGNFTTSTLSNSGITTITIKNIASGGTAPNNCNSTITANNTANITVNGTTTITATAPNSRNNAGTVVLGASAVPSTATISWFSAATGGASLATGNSYTTPSISTTTTYFVQSTNGSCTTSTRTGVTATVYYPEIDIKGNNNSIPDGDTTPTIIDFTDFGSTQFLNDPIVKTFSILNTGTGNLNLTGTPIISITGSTDFTVETNPSTSITSSGSSTFKIRFNPSSSGLKSATITIANDDNNENPYNFAIQGTGIQGFFDSDGDGVYDNVDVDDDNDGIKDNTEEANCRTASGYNVNYKFLNETFGTGPRAPLSSSLYASSTNYCYEEGPGGSDTPGCPDLDNAKLDDGEYTIVSVITKPGSIATDPANIHQSFSWYDGEDHTSGDTNGRMAVFNASFTRGVFYETTISGILSNIPITYSFWVLNILSKTTNDNASMIDPNITVEFLDLTGTIITSINTGDVGRCSSDVLDNSCAQGVWQQFTTSVNLGNVNTFTIRFINNAPGGSGNDLAIDDILIAQTLCDKDADGVPDLFDLDCDNDGIEDVIEAGLGNLSNGKGKIDVTWVDANGNGLLDSAESTANQPALDSDGDGIPNYIDLDSDNDSLFDVDESGAGNTNAASGYANGDGDINGDGKGDGLESEVFRSKDFDANLTVEGFGDGILDIYDYGIVAGATTSISPADFKIAYGNSGQGTTTTNTATTYLKDNDNDGIPDYLDLQSNGTTLDIANNKLIYDYKVVDSNNDGKIDGTADIDKDGIIDSYDTNTAYFGSPRNLYTKLFLDFDGRNDYGQSTAILGGLANASLMAWINLNSSFSTDGVIVGQNNFQIRITSAKKLEAVVNGIPYTYDTALNVSQWYNVAATYDGTHVKLYLNGALIRAQAKSGALAADTSLLTIGRDPATNGPAGTKYFKGKIDEVRIFNVALQDYHLQRMVYQEIDETSVQLKGKIIPKTIAKSTDPAIPFTNLLRYYRMDTYKDDIVDDLTTPSIDLVTGMKIYNHKNIYLQQAPMPFLTERSGDFASAVNSSTKQIRGADIMEQNWSIVKVQHDITETANNIDLGMIVDAGKNIVMNNNTKIQNDWYLKLDGKIDLVGMAQLVQTSDSELEATSYGSIERDQQGQGNKYNYNYWSSPVNSLNNSNYSIAEVMKDGTDPINLKAITWIGGYDGSSGSNGSPISLARYWLYKFDNSANAYANWSKINETSSLRVGQGYTLKGSGTSGTQNYTFVGKPNNGLIVTNIVGANQLLLAGNPYPSALDSEAFINDNLLVIDNNTSNSSDGALYFWEHYSTNTSHFLKDYQGGYAVRNLTGGIAPSSANVDFISRSGSPSRGIPNRYIPVGQAFFIRGRPNSSDPRIIFKNSQRLFIRETEGLSNVLFKIQENKKVAWDNNNSDLVPKDTIKKIRLGFNSYNNYHKQLLLGFIDEKASDAIDYGYDASSFDNLPNDIYFLTNDWKLIIQGVGSFDISASYPLGIKTDALGKVQFLIDELENFDHTQSIYIHDNETDTYHDISKKVYEVTLQKGENNTRFSLRFTDKTLGVVDNTAIINNRVTVAFLKNENALQINNSLVDTTVKKVSLLAMTGQAISSWKIDNQEQKNIQLPTKKISSGVYIVKIQTTKGDFSKKIIIR